MFQGNTKQYECDKKEFPWQKLGLIGEAPDRDEQGPTFNP